MNAYLPRILITGGHGQLATAMRHHPLASEFFMINCSHAQLDITDMNSVDNTIADYSPDIIVNAAAFTAVDKAEQETHAAVCTNHLGAQNLAIACAKQQLPLIHISTDYIFDGSKATPYHEEDLANPINVYGRSKWLGEQAVLEESLHAIVLRVSGVFSEFGNNFLKTMLHLAAEKNELRIVADQVTCPTYATDIASTIFAIAKHPIHLGIYHYCSARPVSWHEFAVSIISEAKNYKKFALEEIKPISAADYVTAAKRPVYSVLDCAKIKKDYGINQPNWEMAVKQIVKNIMVR